MYKHRNGLASVYMSDIFSLSLSGKYKNGYTHSLVYDGAKICNDIPINIRY